jgi:DNA ligase-1
MLGTGLKDADRRNPPSIGTVITFRYRELTNRGLPRFASYYRVSEF